MTDELRRLAKETEDARMTYECWGMTNIAGKTPEQRAEIDLGYRVAEQKYFRLLGQYRAAIEQAAANA